MNFKLQRCRALARNILHLYPLPGIGTNPKSSATGLLYPQVNTDIHTVLVSSYRICSCALCNEQKNPLLFTASFIFQFELLLIMIAIEAHEISKGTPSSSRTSMSFARKTVGPDTLISRIVSDFLKDIRLGTSAPYVRSVQQSENSHLDEGKSSKPEDADDIDSDSDSSSHNPSASSDCLDQYTSSLQHSRQAMLCRMSEHFETIENYLLADTETCPGPTQTLLNFIANNRREDAQFNSRMRFASKPVVISDAIPLPSALCPQAVEQLLLSALAHHNLGSFKESIMFLDAARTQFIELQKSSGHNDSHDINEVPFELEAYMILSKGNLYRSAGEDEQAMNCYIDGWRFSKEQQQTDWDIIFVNSIGVLAYYSIRYDIALMCFNKVARYREQEYGADSADTATALNNEGCSLFCMHERSEARLRFERCWIVGKSCTRCDIIIWSSAVR